MTPNEQLRQLLSDLLGKLHDQRRCNEQAIAATEDALRAATVAVVRERNLPKE